MTNLATAAKAKLEIQHEGESYWLSPIELRDLAELQQRLDEAAGAPGHRVALRSLFLRTP